MCTYVCTYSVGTVYCTSKFVGGIHTHTHTYMYIYIYMQIYTYIHIYMYVCVYVQCRYSVLHF